MSTEIILHTTPKSELKNLIAEAIKEQLSTFFEKKDTEDKLLTRKQVSGMLSISLPTLHTWTKEGIIQGIRIGSSIRYKSSEIEKALQNIQSIKYSRYNR
jgi:excisionase family DNA binding protein